MRYFKAAKSPSSRQGHGEPQQADYQLFNINAVENTATGPLAVATASSSLGKDTSEADQDHNVSPCHSDKESETEGPTLQPLKRQYTAPPVPWELAITCQPPLLTTLKGAQTVCQCHVCSLSCCQHVVKKLNQWRFNY